ncbi:MAG: hypothetical protein LIO58_04730 [Oscillospiraceae bacterium]|nr:hypothetical protein [Oscillospiraceae bacterium]
MDSPHEAKDILTEWIENEAFDLSDRVSQSGVEFDYKAKPYKPEHIEPAKPMPQVALDEIYSACDRTLETLNRLRWHTEDGIAPEILKEFGVAYSPENGTIILPHHNINGDIVGLYERNFLPLRKFVKEYYPDMPPKIQLKFPRAKYVPLLRSEKYQTG